MYTMTNLLAAVFVFALSATVLGVASNFAKLFMLSPPDDYTIFSLVAPSVTIFILCMCRLQFAQPVVEVIAHVVLGILWLSESTCVPCV
ncbi:hypothetical protein EDC04DRAFT_2622064 [Pisolithus marmoratus]|nr:hypothetical protein EDC04DRAFT_2622064 [Pisolithus marmoratus]